MRVALFSDTYLPQVNGVSRTLARLVSHLAARGDRVALVTPEASERPAPHTALHLRLPGIPVPMYPELRLARFLDRSEATRLEAFAPELVHVCTEFTVGWSGRAWARRLGLPLVSSFHTDFPAYLAGYGLGGLEAPLWRYLAFFHSASRATFCPSRATLGELRRQGFHDRMSLWLRGVDASLFSPRRRSERTRRWLAPRAERIVLYVGRLAPEKRIDILLSAFQEVRRAIGERAALVLVGDGPLGPELRRTSPQGVRFTGYLSGPALAEVYASADLFVFPSDTETFGNVVLEAMASGLPVVAADRGGVTESVHTGETGLLVPAGSSEGFAQATLTLLTDEPRRAELARGARGFARQRTWTRVLDDLRAEYERILAGSRRAVAA